MRLGTTLERPTAVRWMAEPNRRSGKCASVSAERPTMKTPNVKTAVKNGDEKDANTVAIAVMMPTSASANAAAPATTRRSSGASAASNQPEAHTTAAHGIGTYVRVRGKRHATRTATPTLTASVATAGTGRPLDI